MTLLIEKNATWLLAEIVTLQRFAEFQMPIRGELDALFYLKFFHFQAGDSQLSNFE